MQIFYQHKWTGERGDIGHSFDYCLLTWFKCKLDP